jgi:hypothetical protein
MRVFNEVAASTIDGMYVNRTDIQIQSNTAYLGFVITGINGVDTNLDDISIRVKHISSKGTQVIYEKTPLGVILEIGSSQEGFYRSGVDAEGLVDLTKDAKALDLSGGYLSLDIESKNGGKVVEMSVYALDTAEETSFFQYMNPVYLNGGITKSINVRNVDTIALDHTKIESINLQFPKRAVTYLAAELRLLANKLNDLVTDRGSLLIVGYEKFCVLPVVGVTEMTITPAVTEGFYVYMLEEKSV